MMALDKMPDDIVLYISGYLSREDNENLSKTSLFFFWSLWDVSTCYWDSRELPMSHYDIYVPYDFVPFCWYPHPNKCNGGCLGLVWYRMCKRCQEWEEDYYDRLYDEEEFYNI